MERPLKHVDPAVEFHRLITSHIQEQLKAQPGILFGVVVEHAPGDVAAVALGLLGVSAPDEMTRLDDEDADA